MIIAALFQYEKGGPLMRNGLLNTYLTFLYTASLSLGCLFVLSLVLLQSEIIRKKLFQYKLKKNRPSLNIIDYQLLKT